MLNKKNRLTSKFQFNVTKKHGEYLEGSLMHVYLLKPLKYNGPTKVGLVISNQLHKRANKRNRLRRIFREVIRGKIRLLGENRWVVVYPKFESLGKKYEEINSDFNQVLQKISKLR